MTKETILPLDGFHTSCKRRIVELDAEVERLRVALEQIDIEDGGTPAVRMRRIARAALDAKETTHD